jgi:hypothetical protein
MLSHSVNINREDRPVSMSQHLLSGSMAEESIKHAWFLKGEKTSLLQCIYLYNYYFMRLVTYSVYYFLRYLVEFPPLELVYSKTRSIKDFKL